MAEDADETKVAIFTNGIAIRTGDQRLIDSAFRRARGEAAIKRRGHDDGAALVLICEAYLRDAGRRSRE